MTNFKTFLQAGECQLVLFFITWIPQKLILIDGVYSKMKKYTFICEAE